MRRGALAGAVVLFGVAVFLLLRRGDAPEEQPEPVRPGASPAEAPAPEAGESERIDGLLAAAAALPAEMRDGGFFVEIAPELPAEATLRLLQGLAGTTGGPLAILNPGDARPDRCLDARTVAPAPPPPPGPAEPPVMRFVVLF